MRSKDSKAWKRAIVEHKSHLLTPTGARSSATSWQAGKSPGKARVPHVPLPLLALSIVPTTSVGNKGRDKTARWTFVSFCTWHELKGLVAKFRELNFSIPPSIKKHITGLVKAFERPSKCLFKGPCLLRRKVPQKAKMTAALMQL